MQMLAEIAIKMNLVPFYELIYSGRYSSNMLFKYSVKVGKYSAIGSGRSKKEAKHDAACTVLKIMDSSIDKKDCDLEDTLKKIDELSPYFGNIQENMVGELIEFCNKFNLPKPVFNLLKSGISTNGYFFIFECIVSNWTEIAQSGVKKQAKQVVAMQMINKLQSTIKSFLILIPEIKNQDKVDIIKDPSTNWLKLGLKLSKYHKFLDTAEFENIPLPTLNGLRDKELEWIINHPSIEELLDNILLELNFTREIKVFKNKVCKELKSEYSNTSLDNENQTKEEDDKIKNSGNENVFDKSSTHKKLKIKNDLIDNPNGEMVYVILTIHNCFPVQVFTGAGSIYEDAIKNATLTALKTYFYLSKSLKSLEWNIENVQ